MAIMARGSENGRELKKTNLYYDLFFTFWAGTQLVTEIQHGADVVI